MSRARRGATESRPADSLEKSATVRREVPVPVISPPRPRCEDRTRPVVSPGNHCQLLLRLLQEELLGEDHVVVVPSRPKLVHEDV